MKKVTLLLLCLFAYGVINAQEDFDAYFDDGGISQSNFKLKLEATALLRGCVPFSAQVKLFDLITLEGGGGWILPYRAFDLQYLLYEGDYPIAESYGYSWKAEANLLIWQKDVNNVGVGLGYQHNKYDVYKINDYYGHILYSINVNRRWVVEYQIGLKMSVFNDPKWNSLEALPFYKFAINLAYLL